MDYVIEDKGVLCPVRDLDENWGNWDKEIIISDFEMNHLKGFILKQGDRILNVQEAVLYIIY